MHVALISSRVGRALMPRNYHLLEKANRVGGLACSAKGIHARKAEGRGAVGEGVKSRKLIHVNLN